MCEITIRVKCPPCHGTKVNKNGVKANGRQNFICIGCKKQFQYKYVYNGARPETKHLIISMLLRNSGIRDVEPVLKVSRRCVLNTLLDEGRKCVIRPKQSYYKPIQIDEHWSYVKHKKGKALVDLRLGMKRK